MHTPLWLFRPHAYMYFYCFVVYALSVKTLNAYTKDLWCMHWVPCHGTQCVHHRTIGMHICMRRKQSKWCTHWVQEISKQVYALSWCKPVVKDNQSRGQSYRCASTFQLWCPQTKYICFKMQFVYSTFLAYFPYKPQNLRNLMTTLTLIPQICRIGWQILNKQPFLYHDIIFYYT